PNDSTACHDGVLGSGGAGALGNNQASVAFDVALPRFDLQQAKERLQGRPGDPPVLAGQTLKYRFGVFNRGPSRAEGVELVDVVTLPAGGFGIAIVGAAQEVNAVNMAPGSTAAARFNGSVSCAMEPAPGSTPENVKLMRCRLHPDAAQSYLDGGESVSFVIEFQAQPPAGQAWGDFSTALTVSNAAYVCGDESNVYESDGECVHTRPGFPNLPESELVDAANNRAGVSNTVMPVTDLAVSSKTAGVSPADLGQSVPWSIVLRNNGASASAGMRVVDLLPAGFEWIPGDGSAAAPYPAVGTPTNGAVPSAPGGVLAVAAAPPAPDAADVCYVSNGIATVTAPGQRQEVTCHINGSFPADSGYPLPLHAQPKLGVYAGPWLSDVLNEVSVEPGRDATGNPLSADDDPANNAGDGPVQVREAAALGGRVFFDRNHNGDQDAPADTALAGVVIRLTGTDLHGTAIDLTATTDASGDYRFTGLPPSDADGYTLTQTQPAGYDNGTPQPNTPRTVRNGTSVGTTPAGADYVVTNTATTSVIAGVVLAGGADGVQFDFPEYTGVSLSGRVYEDADRNDAWTPGTDAPIPNATVDLLVWDAVGSSYVFARSVTSDANGEYSFNDLDPALTYAVRQPVPTGFVDRSSATNPGLINGAACVAPATCAASDGT
ncbi:MAG: hypothetical protein GX805_12725, partial [Gammaproteobacteria bacterium]|nr:hypothetical protein [Gammaproteobacteria bacterium]